MTPLYMRRLLPLAVMFLAGCNTLTDIGGHIHEGDKGDGGLQDVGLDVDEGAEPDVSDRRDGPDEPEVVCNEVEQSGYVVELVAGKGDHTCARMADGTARCWGSNSFGQLGDGTRLFFIKEPVESPVFTDITQIALGFDATCALDNVGHVWCVGDNSVGQLGAQEPNDVGHSHLPLRVSGLENVLQIKAGGGHACALLPPNESPNREVWCWGDNNSGQTGPELGIAFRAKKIPFPEDVDPAELELGELHSCVRSAAGTVWCWGMTLFDALGRQRGENGAPEVCDPDGDFVIDCPFCDPCPGFVSGLHAVSSLSTQFAHTCAVNAEEGIPELYCWGSNEFGQLGTLSPESTSTPALVPYFNNEGLMLDDVAVGGYHTCARAEGSVYCWGLHEEGQLGIGHSGMLSASQPTLVRMGQGMEALSLGENHTCAKDENQEVFCWGQGGSGQLGNNEFFDQDRPVRVIGLTNVRQVDVNSNHSCAVTQDGKVFCWGANANGEVALGTPLSSATPQQVVDLQDIRGLGLGEAHTCGFDTSGELSCWGQNFSGQLGDGTHRNAAAPVATFDAMSTTAHVSAGNRHTCALDPEGALRCWGRGERGQLGEGVLRDRITPPLDPILTGVDLLAAGGDHTCVVVESGQVRCWGINNSGQVGVTSPFDQQLGRYEAIPVDVPEMSDAIALAAGFFHTCAIRSDKSLWCWGRNEEGQLGDETLDSREAPRRVAGLPPVVAVSAGFFHTCALDEQDAVWCWGSNNFGQLGYTPARNSLCDDCQPSPRPLPLDGVTELVSGRAHNCVLKGKGEAWCWGFNATGALGNGNFEYTEDIHPVAF